MSRASRAVYAATTTLERKITVIDLRTLIKAVTNSYSGRQHRKYFFHFLVDYDYLRWPKFSNTTNTVLFCSMLLIRFFLREECRMVRSLVRIVRVMLKKKEGQWNTLRNVQKRVKRFRSKQQTRHYWYYEIKVCIHTHTHIYIYTLYAYIIHMYLCIYVHMCMYIYRCVSTFLK